MAIQGRDYESSRLDFILLNRFDFGKNTVCFGVIQKAKNGATRSRNAVFEEENGSYSPHFSRSVSR